jgi:RimJ/RimL family protein N-acetyltransferase
MAVSRGTIVVLRPLAPTDPGTLASRARVVRSMRRAGEPVYAAALRALTAAGVAGPAPWAVDLSGVQAVYAADVADTVDLTGLAAVNGEDAVAAAVAVPPVSLAFRPLTRADLPDLVRWFAAPHVARWWHDGPTDTAAAERRYVPGIEGSDPVRRWVVEVNGRSVGLVQDYRIGDHPEYALRTARPDAVGIDYLTGEPGWVGRGVGTRVLWQYLLQVVRPGYPDATEVFAAPDHRNRTSLRVLDKLGFAQGLWFDEPRRDGGVDTVIGCTLDLRRVLGRAPRRVTDR